MAGFPASSFLIVGVRDNIFICLFIFVFYIHTLFSCCMTSEGLKLLKMSLEIKKIIVLKILIKSPLFSILR